MSDKINYADALGFHSIAGAVVFSILYVPLFARFLRQSFQRPTYVFIVLTLFCSIRIAAFVIRAVLAGSESAGETLSLFIADQVLFGVGFFGLLYSGYTLVLDRELLTRDGSSQNFFNRITGNRRLFRVVMMAAVILGIVGSSQADSSDPTKGTTLRKVSTIIFLVLTTLLAYRTIVLARTELSSGYRHADGSIGGDYGAYVLCVIAGLLLVREVFATATMGSLEKQNNERLWYPLSALPEIVAVTLYAAPGLVPPRSELPT
ncbi:hypothetical protein BDZ94DRAFT_1163890 [Collybia nuda]|uniref:DUF7702 domain-containing protein n=1 Tax=Collybia nuda TaxID=64659 RepID=A0A9P5Y4M8_9AGAR|nr:hypothetical protein BDZ94DRAFT_1163890 [Collybia nuda]